MTYRAYSAPYPVAGRDFVVMNSRRPLKNNEGFAVFGTSINHSFTNPEGRCVRGNAIVSGFIFRPISGNQRLLFFSVLVLIMHTFFKKLM